MGLKLLRHKDETHAPVRSKHAHDHDSIPSGQYSQNQSYPMSEKSQRDSKSPAPSHPVSEIASAYKILPTNPATYPAISPATVHPWTVPSTQSRGGRSGSGVGMGAFRMSAISMSDLSDDNTTTTNTLPYNGDSIDHVEVERIETSVAKTPSPTLTLIPTLHLHPSMDVSPSPSPTPSESKSGDSDRHMQVWNRFFTNALKVFLWSLCNCKL